MIYLVVYCDTSETGRRHSQQELKRAGFIFSAAAAELLMHFHANREAVR